MPYYAGVYSDIEVDTNAYGASTLLVEILEELEYMVTIFQDVMLKAEGAVYPISSIDKLRLILLSEGDFVHCTHSFLYLLSIQIWRVAIVKAVITVFTVCLCAF
jgi:hypothetical protein